MIDLSFFGLGLPTSATSKTADPFASSKSGPTRTGPPEMMVRYRQGNVDTRKRVQRPGLSPYVGTG